MKLLMIYCDRFAWTPGTKSIPDAPEARAGDLAKLVAGWVQVEQEDADREGKVMTKLVKNLKWLAGKNGTKRIVLHSFSHLSESKAAPELSQAWLDRAKERLEGSGYEVYQTPWGYFLDLHMDAPGHPLARVFKSF